MSNLLTPPIHLAPLYLSCLLASPALAQDRDVAQLDAITISGKTLDEVALARAQLDEVPGGTNVVGPCCWCGRCVGLPAWRVCSVARQRRGEDQHPWLGH